MNKSLDDIRREIDGIDRQIVELLKARMEAAGCVAVYKQERGLPVLDSGREQALLTKVEEQAGEEFAGYARSIYEAILRASRAYQHEKMEGPCTRSNENAFSAVEHKKRYGLIGEKLGHSFSPGIHNRLGGYPYSLFELNGDELGDFLLHGNFAGLNVTIPYKKAVIPYCKTLTPQARRIGSVNTIVRQPDGSLLGHNTDYDGFFHTLHTAGIRVEGKKALVLGTGGASLTVHAVLEDLGAGERVAISRTGPNNYQNLALHSDAQIIINTTPVGMYPDTDACPVDLSLFPRLEGVVDLIYNPARTRLLQQAEKRGIPNANGLRMLVAQAKAAAERFLERDIPDRRVEEIVREMEWETRNLILIGMPGCGKTTIGRALAARLGRKLADMDSLIVERAGCSIPEIFARDGEEAFRRLEHEVLCEVSKQSGLVIATGGGVVTRPENFAPLRQNSWVIFVHRDLELLPTEGRPISQANGLEDLYRQRKPLYEAAADIEVDNIIVEDTVDDIIGRLAT